MSDLPVLSGPFRQPRSGKPARQLVVFLHGWGADGPNLIDLADMFSPLLPDAYFVAPNAPYPCEVNPYGYQWFSLVDRQPQHMLEGVKNAAKILDHFLDNELKTLGLDNSKLILIGFSQGTMTALHVALRRSPPIGALIGFSGALIGSDKQAEEIVAKPPICLIHGEMDDVVPYKSLQLASEMLNGFGITAQAHTRPGLGHSIDMDGIRHAAEFLKKNVK